MNIFDNASGLFPRRRATKNWPVAMLAFFLFALCSLVLADGRIIRVARISLIEGEVSYQRANDSNKDWFDATHNLPLDESDQLYSGPDGRAEIQLSGRNIVRIDRNTNLRFTQFNTGTIQLALSAGTATFRIDSLDRRQFQVVDARDGNLDDPVYFEVDTPTVAITLLKEGNYRVNVRDDGTTEVIVRRGQAEIYNQELGTITVKQGRRFTIDGSDADNFQIARLEDKDNWDRWNDRRDDELFARVDSDRSTRYVPTSIPGVYDLDLHGEWFETPDYGWVWAPRAVAVGWAPYRQGYWRWYPSYGWTWISSEPWGWVPYHYGRWAYWRSRWCWVPTVGFGVGLGLSWNWSPHMVVFFGWGGGNYRRGYRDGYWDGFRDGRGWLGWCPLAPGDRYYGHRAIANNNTRIDSLRNYHAPGGVSGMESRRFAERRAIVTNDAMAIPPRGGSRTEDPTPMVVRVDEIKPTQTAPRRTALVERADVARKLEAPVIMRRTAADSSNPNRPSRSLDDASRSSKVVRDGVVTPSRSDRTLPTRNGETGTSSPTRINDGVIQRSDRPTRYTDYKQVERVDPPARRSTDGNNRSIERSDSSREVNSPPRENSMPNRGVDRPSRVEPEQRRVEPPSRPPMERREMPRREPRESAPPRSESRRPDPPPAREPMPSRNVERPSSPPPARENAPSRNAERPSPPPARENAPSRNPERSMPSRKPVP
jgi:hypothetical protein